MPNFGALPKAFGLVRKSKTGRYAINKLLPRHDPHEIAPFKFTHQDPNSLFQSRMRNLHENFNKKPDPKKFGEYLDPKKFGDYMANKYFKKEYIKGFRWGFKAGKRIYSVPLKCEKALNITSCPQAPQPSPFPGSVPQPQPSPFPASAVVNCIVEVINLGKSIICLQPYESYQIPPEATCELDHPDKLNATYCLQN